MIKLPKSKNTVCADLGLKHLIVTCKGHKEPNPKYTKQYATEIAYYQRKLSKKKLGSASRYKAKLKVARIHAKIADCRNNHTHKATYKLYKLIEENLSCLRGDIEC